MVYKTKACFALAGGDEGRERERERINTSPNCSYILVSFRQFDSLCVWQSLTRTEVKLPSRTSTEVSWGKDKDWVRVSQKNLGKRDPYSQVWDCCQLDENISPEWNNQAEMTESFIVNIHTCKGNSGRLFSFLYWSLISGTFCILDLYKFKTNKSLNKKNP